MEDWHISDHRPIRLLAEVEVNPDLSGLVKRATDLNFEYSPTHDEIKQLRGNYDFDAVQDDLLQHRYEIESSVNTRLMNDNIVGAIDILDEHIKAAHKGKKKKFVSSVVSISMDNVNRLFDEYVNTLSNNAATEEDINISMRRYISARKSVTSEVMKTDSDRWSEALKSSDGKAFWKLVDWKGNLKNKKAVVSPTIQEFELFFHDLYKCANNDELLEILQIESDVTVPVLDDPITDEEIKCAWRNMKKSGYDYNMEVLNILVTFFSLILVNMMNMFFCEISNDARVLLIVTDP